MPMNISLKPFSSNAIMTLKPHRYPLPKANCGHKGGYKMKITLITKIALLGLLIVGLAAGLGCGYKPGRLVTNRPGT